MSRRLEGSVELYLRGQVRALGGDTRKWVSPGRRGVPDQIVLWPGERTDFIEAKLGAGRLSVFQVREHARLGALGKHVFTLRSKAEVDDYIATVKKEYLWIFQNSRSTK